MIYQKEGTRIWPKLLEASAGASLRASRGDSGVSDVLTSVILSRSAIDAYLHELIAIRRLPSFVKTCRRHGAKKREVTVFVSESRHSLPALGKNDFKDLKDLSLREKLQTVLVLMDVKPSDSLSRNFAEQFSDLFRLNSLRNAIVHHEFAVGSRSLKETCAKIRERAAMPPADELSPWEEVLESAAIAKWSCNVAAKAILDIEGVPFQRAIPYSSTQGVVASAVSSISQ